MVLTKRTVIGTYRTIEDKPCVGYVEFTPTSFIVKSGTAIVLPQTIRVDLDANGSFSVDLAVSTDTLWAPEWYWTVEEKMQGGKYWYFELPDGVGSFDISTVVPVNPPYAVTVIEKLQSQIYDLTGRVRLLERRNTQ